LVKLTFAAVFQPASRGAILRLSILGGNTKQTCAVTYARRSPGLDANPALQERAQLRQLSPTQASRAIEDL